MKQEFNEVVDFLKQNQHRARPMIVLVKGNVSSQFGLENVFNEILAPVQKSEGCPLPGTPQRDLGFGCGSIYKGQFTAFSFSDTEMFEKAQTVLSEKGFEIQPIILRAN